MYYFKIIFLLFFSIILTGCAGGRNYDYTRIPLDLHLDNNKEEIALGVHDQREYVTNGEKYPQYVGTQRSPAYVPWNINTKSGKSMADDFLFNISNSLKTAGYKVRPISLTEKETKQEALSKLKETGDNRLLLFTINEWFFDVWNKTRMSYSLKLEVFDKSGRRLAYDSIGKHMWNDNDNAIPDLEFKSAVEHLLSNDKIAKGLDTNLTHPDFEVTPPSTGSIDANEDVSSEKVENKSMQNDNSLSEEPKKVQMTCTTDQILEMKKIGMADEQIKAACK